MAWRKRMLAAAFAIAIVPAGAAWAVPAKPRKPLSITIGGLAYSAPSVTVHAGDTIEWINKDIVDHNVTEKQHALWDVSMAPGKSAKVVMKTPGSYTYYCRYHPNMTASVTVVAAGKR